MIYINLSEYLQKLPTFLQNKNQTVIGTSNETCILQGENMPNLIEGIPVYKTHDFGGSIIHFKEDVSVSNYQSNFNDWGDNLMDIIANYLKSKGINAVRKGNDILIDECYKVASYMSEMLNGCLYTAAHISIGMDLDLIKKVCTKEMIKIPKGLKDYGITKEEIISLIEREVNDE